jgi:single-strand DNA-binding protein
MQIIGVARLGKDCELRHIQSGDAVTNLSLAYNYGKKDQQGNRPSQWIEGVLWGKRAEGLVQYLVKGQQVCVTLDDVHTEEYTKNSGGTGFKLVGAVTNIEFVGSKPDNAGQQQQARPAAAPAQRPAPVPQPQRHDSFDDSEVPF